MNRWARIALLTALFALMVVMPVLAQARTGVTNITARLHDGPSLSATLIWVIPAGTQVEIDGSVNGDIVTSRGLTTDIWYQVRVADFSGYIWSGLITVNTTAPQVVGYSGSERVFNDCMNNPDSSQVIGLTIESNPDSGLTMFTTSPWNASVPIPTEFAGQLFSWTGENFWIGYDNLDSAGNEGFAYETAYPVYFGRIVVYMRDGKRYFLFLQAAGHIANGRGGLNQLSPTDTVFIQSYTYDRLDNPNTDANGNHYGVHPCAAIKMPAGSTGLIDLFNQVIASV